MPIALQLALKLALQLVAQSYPDSSVEVIGAAPCSQVLPDDSVDHAVDTLCVEIWETCADPSVHCYHIVEVDLRTMVAIAAYDSTYTVEWSAE